MYYSYHNKIKKLIKENKLISAEWHFERFNSVYIKNVSILVLVFKDGTKKPIRPHAQEEYLEILKNKNILIK